MRVQESQQSSAQLLLKSCNVEICCFVCHMHLAVQPHTPRTVAASDRSVIAQSDMGVVLGILLDPITDVGAHLTKADHLLQVAAALQSWDPDSGLILLGQAVTFGYDDAVLPILNAVR